MKLLFVFLGVVFGVFLFLMVIVLLLILKFKKIGREFGYTNLRQIKELIKKGEEEANNNHKMVSGMSNLLVPKIVKDFPNFSESELYNKVETSLLAIFSSLEKKEVSNLKELMLIKNKLSEQIKDMIENKIEISFDETIFHNHAIKSYEKEKGSLEVVVSSSLEYYYSKKKNGEDTKLSKSCKKQTSYTTTLIYIYDMDKYDNKQTLIGIHCPNCGAPLKSLNDRVCKYCSSGLEDINLKYWYVSSYKEDY